MATSPFAGSSGVDLAIKGIGRDLRGEISSSSFLLAHSLNRANENRRTRLEEATTWQMSLKSAAWSQRIP